MYFNSSSFRSVTVVYRSQFEIFVETCIFIINCMYKKCMLIFVPDLFTVIYRLIEKYYIIGLVLNHSSRQIL